MFIGKSFLASVILSTVVVTSGGSGAQIAGGRADGTAAQVTAAAEVPPVPENLQNSDTSGKGSQKSEAAGPESAQKTKAAQAPEGTAVQETVAETEADTGTGAAENRTDVTEDGQEESREQETAQEETQSEEEIRNEQETFDEEEQEEDEGEIPLLEGTSLAMLASRGRAQMLSTVIRSEDGRLVVVDGGWQSDGDYLMETIRANGGTVDAWLITHPHSDHVGALTYILKNYGDEININKIYYSFAPVSWYEEVEPKEAKTVADLVEEFEKLPEDMLCGNIGRGDKFKVGNIKITVVNDRYTLEEDPVNNSSIVYRIDAGRKSVLFLGDMAYAAGSLLVRDGGSNIDTDIVQMAHHGQNGVGHSVYQLISPKICLWPTPQWLWDNDNGGGYNSGPWQTILTRNFVETLKVKEQYCTKDGDIVLSLN